MNNFSRRGFVARTTKASASLLALLAGVVPELSNSAPLAVGSGSPATEPVGPPPPLNPTAEATLYSQALNDADVLVLMATLVEQGRLDPPSSSVDYASTVTGQTAQQVFIPVRSYATGLTLAFLIYGTGMGIGPNGLQPGIVKALVSNTGTLQFAASGKLYPTPVPELAFALFVLLFPDQYANQAAGTAVNTASAASRSAFKFRKVMQAVQNPDLSDCMFKARYTFTACIQKVQAVIAAAMIGCVLMLLCLGILVFGGPATWALVYSCTGTGVATLATIAAAQAMANACNTTYQSQLANCRDQFPVAV